MLFWSRVAVTILAPLGDSARNFENEYDWHD